MPISVRNLAEYLTETSALQQVQKKTHKKKRNKEKKSKIPTPKIVFHYKPEYQQNT